MKIILLIFCGFLCYSLQAQHIESQSRTGETQQIFLDTISVTPTSYPQSSKANILKSVQASQNEVYTELKPQQKSIHNKRFLKHLKWKKSIAIDTPAPKINSKRGKALRLGCFLKEPLEFIVLGVEMFELTKPPKNPFLIILYVIYIVPLFAIITVFISLGVSGLVTFIFLCGLFSFLVYWGILALIGISLGGLFLLWGVIGAFIIGLILYLWLISLC
ncbi:hypothetical protein AD998_15270 [bacterium 336/3]|nr:hypothetical protein AD998_15270 [bacterium 336/3]